MTKKVQKLQRASLKDPVKVEVSTKLAIMAGGLLVVMAQRGSVLPTLYLLI